MLLISHNLPQVYDVCDRVVVLFRGETVANLTSTEAIVISIAGFRGHHFTSPPFTVVAIPQYAA